MSSKHQAKLLGMSSTDPSNPCTATGSRFYLWSTLRQKGALVDAFSPYPSELMVKFFKLLSFKPDVQLWKANWHSSVKFRRYLSAAAIKRIKQYDHGYFNSILQTGAYFDISAYWKGYKALIADNNCMVAHATNIDYKSPESSFQRHYEYEKRVYNSMDHIFSYNSLLARSFIEDFGCSEKKVKVVYAGVNFDERLLSNQRNDYNSKTVLFSGFNFKGKGGEILLEAFEHVIRECPDARLVLLGPAKRNFPDFVLNHGPLLQTDPEQMSIISECYRNASVFALPTLGDAFPNVIREAMAARLPCVASDTTGIPDMVIDGVTGYLIPQRNPKALADRLLKLLKNPDLCRKMGEAGYKRYKDNFTWDSVCDKILGHINEGIGINV